MDEGRRVIENGAIVVRGKDIEWVGSAADARRRFPRTRTIDARGKLVIPGLINAHTHIPMTLFRGISDDLDLNEWLTKFIFPAEAKNVTEAFVRAGTKLGLAEMIRGGTTTYCDMYYFEDAIAEETKRAGVRGVLGETVIDFPVADNKTHEQAMAYSERFIRRWKNDPLIVAAIAPHAPYTVSTEHLKAVRSLSDKLDAPVVIHVAETKKERDDILAQKGATPMKYLADIGFLSSRVITAHDVFVNDAEIETMRRLGVGAVHCPQSNMKLASGTALIPQMLRAGLRLGLGTDGPASNNDLDMWDEMDSAAKLHKLVTGDPKVVSAPEAFAMATIGGARALHMEKLIGSLEKGKRADIAIVDTDSFHQLPAFNVYSQLVYSTKAADVRTVMVNGTIIMQDRRLLTLDESAIKVDANAYRNRIILSLSK